MKDSLVTVTGCMSAPNQLYTNFAVPLIASLDSLCYQARPVQDVSNASRAGVDIQLGAMEMSHPHTYVGVAFVSYTQTKWHLLSRTSLRRLNAANEASSAALQELLSRTLTWCQLLHPA